MTETSARTPGNATETAGDIPPPSSTPNETDATPVNPSARIRAERVVLYLAALVAVLTPVVAAVDVSFPGRTLLALLFTLAVPGVPLVSLLRIPDAALASSLAGAVSISCALLAATVALATGWWSPLAWAAVLAAVALLATVWALRALGRRPNPAGSASADVHATPAERTGFSVWSRPVSAVALLAALGLWRLATRWVDLDSSGPLGVIGVVGWPYVVAIVLVAAVAAVQLLRPQLDALMLAGTAVVLALMIFAFVNVADGEASVSTGWLHVGFARFIDVHQSSFTGLDARASWPGFFAATAQLVRLAGVPDASAFLQLAPFFYNAAAIAPLLVIARCITRSRRLAWLAVFVYLGANWVQQDYFSPQATAFLLYLVTLAMLLWSATAATAEPLAGSLRARIGQAWRRRPGLPPGTTSMQSLGREAALMLIAAAIVVSHQLTPITLVMGLLLFALTGYTRHRRLWLVVSLLFLAWFSYGATDFWSGHLSTVFGDLGKLTSNLNSAVGSRVVGDPTYRAMQNVRVGWSLFYGVLALVGLWSIRRRPDALLLALIAASAGGLVLVQSYGGEVVLRSFLFAGPILAPLAALALRALTARAALVKAVALTVVLAAFGLLGTLTRGVNVSFERVTHDDVAAAQVLWDRLHRGDSIGYLAPAGAYAANRVGEFEAVLLDPAYCGVPALQCAVNRTPRFILVSRTQDAEEQLVAGQPPGSATALADSLVRGGLYTVIYRGPDAQVLELITQGG